MNICILTYEFPPARGSIGLHILHMAKKLIERGHGVTVVTRAPWNKSFYETYDGVPVYRVRFTYSYPSLFGLHGFFVNRLFKSLEANFDIIYIQGPLSPVIHTSLPVLVTFHGTVRKDIDNTLIRSLRDFVVKTILYRPFCNAEKGLVESADVITTVSQACADEITADYQPDKEVIVTKIVGVDTSFFAPAEEKEPGSYILYTGRLETRKGVMTLIESARYVCAKYPQTKFVLTGRGSTEKHLRKMVSSLGLEQNIHFAGYVDLNTLLKYYQGAIIYVLPSFYEALPASLLQAMSCGISPVATDVEGTSELIIDGENGLLVPPGNPEKLAETILTLLEDEGRRKRIGANAREYIVNNYDWGIVTEKLERAYQLAIETHQRKARRS